MTYKPPTTNFMGPYSPAHRSYRRLFNPVSMYSPGLGSPLGAPLGGGLGGRQGRLPFTGGGGGGTQAGSGLDTPVPGEMGAWQPASRSRPYQGIGKFGVSTLGTGQNYSPTAVRPPQNNDNMVSQLEAMSDPANVDDEGFFQGAIGAVGGLFGQTGSDVGGFIGSGFDLPFETIGNLAGLLGTAIGGGFGPNKEALQAKGIDPQPELRRENWDPAVQEAFDASVRQNPINALLMVSRAQRAQWEIDHAAGRHVGRGVIQNIGPAVSATDQLGTLMELLGAIPALGKAGGPGLPWADRRSDPQVQHGIDLVEEAARTGDLSKIKDERWADVARMAAEGQFDQFGGPGSEERRQKILDRIIVTMGVTFDPEVNAPIVETEWGPGGLQIRSQVFNELLFDLFSDPTLVVGGVRSLISRGAGMAAATANTRYWSAFRELPNGSARAMQEVTKRAVQYTNESDPNRALAALSSQVGGGRQLENRILREVAELPEFAPVRDQALGAAHYLDRWRNRWEPALRPISNAVIVANDPWRLFGGPTGTRSADTISRQIDTIFGSHSTEGVVRGQGSLDAHMQVVDALNQSPGVRANYEKGIAVLASNTSRATLRENLVGQLRRTARLAKAAGGRAEDALGPRFKNTPDEILTEQMRATGSADIASANEITALRNRPLYLATEEGGAEAALARARGEAGTRLRLMGLSPEVADNLSSKMNLDQVSLIDGSYFGFTVEEFTRLRKQMVDSGLDIGDLAAKELTILGPKELTQQKAAEVLAAIERNDVDEVRKALRKYDLLFLNLSEQVVDDADLLRDVRLLITDQMQNGALARDLDAAEIARMSPEMREWTLRNADVGYRPGVRPSTENGWRATFDEASGDIIGINPWIDHVGTLSDVEYYNRFRRFKDLLFRDIRGSRIMADARVRLAQFTANEWGLPQATSDDLFSRFVKAASDEQITPRGMSGEKIYQVVHSQRMEPAIKGRINHRVAVEALTFAFEGNLRHVGATQKLSGLSKRTLGGQTNWLGVVAEKFYPLARFQTNLVFQAQELAEPFIFNLMRGLKPGIKASEMDEKTLKLRDILLTDSRYYDDQTERGADWLFGGQATKDAFNSGRWIGRKMRSMGDRLNIKQIKEVNYARALRRQFGQEFKAAMEQVSPYHARVLRQEYATWDWGEIAVRWMTEKSGIITPTGIIKPQDLGARNIVDLDEVARSISRDLLGSDEISGEALREVVRDGRMSIDTFRSALKEVGADDEYITRAFMTASWPTDVEAWWTEFGLLFHGGNKRATSMSRAYIQTQAAAAGRSEMEHLANLTPGLPLAMDHHALANLKAADKGGYLLMAQVGDAIEDGLVPLEALAARTIGADREYGMIIDSATGKVLLETEGSPWLHTKDGNVEAASISGAEWRAGINEEDLAAGRTLNDVADGNEVLHSHPDNVTHSPDDILFGVNKNASANTVVSPHVTYRLMPHADHGWQTPEWQAYFGTPDIPAGTPYATAQALADYHYGRVYDRLLDDWRNEARLASASLRDDPFYSNVDSPYWNELIESMAQHEAVQALAKRFDWKFSSQRRVKLPIDPVQRHEMLVKFAENGAPLHLVEDFPDLYKAAPLTAENMRGKGTQLAFEADSRHREWAPAADALTPDQQNGVMSHVEDWLRSEIGVRLGVGMTHILRGRGGWVGAGGFESNANIVADLFGVEDQNLAYAAAMGYLLRQDEVVLSRVKANLDVANLDANERWAWQFTIDRELEPDEALRLQEALTTGMGAKGKWGSKVVLTPDGRTAVRFIDANASVGRGRRVKRDTFGRALSDEDRAAINNALLDIEGEVTYRPEVVDYHSIKGDWENTNGKAYIDRIAAYDGTLAREVAGRYVRQTEDRLAQAYRTHAPEQFDAALADARARGVAVPKFRVAGEYEPVPEGVIVSIPGGRDSLREKGRRFSIWEQQIIKSQRLNAAALYNSDPELYLLMMRPIWSSKYKPLVGEGAIEDIYNAFSFAALTANAALDVTEGAYALVRSMAPGAKRIVHTATDPATGKTIRLEGPSDGIYDMFTRAQRVRARIPEWAWDEAPNRGAALQLTEGLRIESGRSYGADWLDDAQKSDIDNLANRINAAMIGLSREDKIALTPKIQMVLDGPASTGGRAKSAAEKAAAQAEWQKNYRAIDRLLRKQESEYAEMPAGWGSGALADLRLQVHPWNAAELNTTDFVTVARPEVRYKGSATNSSWGQIMGWLTDEIFTTDSPGLKNFLMPQAWETRSDWALRMSTILPGIDVKTGMLAAEGLGPSLASHGALDTHMIRYIMDMAQKRGDLDTLLSGLTENYANQLRKEFARTSEGLSDGFKSPKGQRHVLITKKAGMKFTPAVRDRMRKNLQAKISDPNLRAMYDHDDVLERVFNTGGYVNVWGGDYRVIQDYLINSLRPDEVARLRAAGEHAAADMVESTSGGTYQWLLWDRIRSATRARTPLDPHVSLTRGIELTSPRSAADLNRAVEVNRLGSPFDPTQSLLFHQSDGMVRGGTRIEKDGRRTLLATQNVNGITGMHELAHLIEPSLDPSLRNTVLAEYRAATGSKRRSWNPDVSEWWADQFLAWVRQPDAATKVPRLRQSFSYLKKQAESIEASVLKQAEAEVLQAAKDKAVARASKQVARTKPAVTATSKATSAAKRRLATAQSNLRRARGRLGLDVLSERRAQANAAAENADMALTEAKAAVRRLKAEEKAARLKASETLGTPSAGGAATAAKRKTAQREAAEADVARLTDDVSKARKAHGEAAAKENGASKRKQVADWQAERDAAQAEYDKAVLAQRKADEAHAKNTSNLKAARDLRTKPRKVKAGTAPPISPAMDEVFTAIHKAPANADPVNVGKNGPDTAVPYDLQEEAAYQAALLAFSRAEDNAFKLHYYKRGRSLLERSINHPYLGLYPASYMWGKVLPEMLRFLLKSPFGLDFPMGGLALANSMYRNVMIQQMYDPEFREAMTERSDVFRLMSMMSPALPWEVPVNAPLWTRRIAEEEAERRDEIEAGADPADTDLLDPAELGKLTEEMLSYAVGPWHSFKVIGDAVQAASGTIDEGLRAATNQVQGILTGQPDQYMQPATPQPLPGGVESAQEPTTEVIGGP